MNAKYKFDPKSAKYKITDAYYRLKAEGFEAYLDADADNICYVCMERRTLVIKYLEELEQYLLRSADGMQNLYFPSEDSLFETIFFVSHCIY